MPPATAAATPAAGSWGGRLGRHTLYYGVGILVEKGVAFAMLPFYTRYLTPADYGVMALVALTLEVVMIVAGARLATGVHRYYHKAETDEGRRGVVATALVLLAVSFFAVGAVCWLLAADLSALVIGTRRYDDLFRLASASLGFQGLLIVPLAYFRVRGEAGRYTAATLSKLGMQASLNVAFLIAGLGVKAMFVSTLIATSIMGTLLTVVVVRQVGVRFVPATASDLMRYGLPLLGVQIAAFIITFGNRYFLQAAASEAAVGLYNLAHQFGFLVAAVGFAPFATMWEPARFEVAKRPDRDQVFARAFLYMNLLLMFVAVGTVAFVHDMLRIMADPAFHAAAAVVPVIVLAYVMQAWFTFLETGILVRERTGYITMATWVSAAVVLAGYALLIPRWHAWGAAIATVLAFLTRLVLTGSISQRLWPIAYDWRPVLRLSAIAVVAALLGVAVRPSSLTVSVAAHAAVFAAYVLVVWWAVVPAADRTRFLGAARAVVLRGAQPADAAGTGAGR